MNIKTLHIKNYRCIRDDILRCDALTVLVGANGVGKSSFLQALEIFYRPDVTFDAEDFFAHDTGLEVSIAVTFGDLSADAKTLFAKYIEGDTLTVIRVITWHEGDGKASASYHGAKLQVGAFVAVRSGSNATETKRLYNELRVTGQYAGLPTATSKDAVLSALEEWETSHPELCERTRDDGQFFGYKEVSAGYLGKFTKFILVPAVRDASEDGEEGRGSLFTQLIDIAVRSNTTGDAELSALGNEMKERYKAIVETTKSTELKRLEDELTHSLADYVASSDVQLSWGEMPQVQLPPPRAVAKIGEEGHHSAIERKGHGLQRAFIMTLLQYLEVIRSRPTVPAVDGIVPTIPGIVLAIEEPELYQHPDRQRHFAKLLARLAMVAGTSASPSTQVLYTTHSPHFVGLDRFNNIRLTRKKRAPGQTIPEAKIAALSLDTVASLLADSIGGDPTRFTADSLRARLQTLMTPWMNEGFFADVVVLVEGEQDRAAILAAAALKDKDLESIGIAVIPCMGKANLDRPLLVFSGFGIATYCLWDSDKDGSDPKPGTNKLLLRLVNEPEVDYPATVSARYACFEKNLETTLTLELTAAVMDPLVKKLQEDFEMKKDDILKNPAMMSELLKRAHSQGATSGSLSSIVDNILALKS